jgi:hypothetical protein
LLVRLGSFRAVEEQNFEASFGRGGAARRVQDEIERARNGGVVKTGRSIPRN